MQNFIKKTIKGFLCSTFLLATTSNPIIIPQFPEEFVKVDNAPQLTQLSVGQNEVWGIDSENKIYHCHIDQKKFEQVTPKARLSYVSVGWDPKYGPWGIGTNNVPYKFSRKAQNWRRRIGRLRQISVGIGKWGRERHVWGVNEKGKLFHWKDTGVAVIYIWARFKQPQNNLKQVSCGYNQELWVIGKYDNSIWRLSKDKKWEQIKEVDPAVYTPIIGGPLITLKQIDVGDASHVVGVNNNNVAYMRDDKNKVWHKIGSRIQYIAINKAGDIWLIATNGKIYFSNQSVVDQIRTNMLLATDAKERAKKYLHKAKRIAYEAKETEKGTVEAKAKTLVKDVEDAADRAEAESAKANNAYQETKNAAKILELVAAKEATKKAQTAAQNAQNAARDAQAAKAALFEMLKKEK